MGNNSNTININMDFLENELSLIRERNTSIFKNSKYFVISPAINNDYNWFDLRKVNLLKYNSKVSFGYLLIRLKSEFILLKLDDVIDKLIDNNKYIYTKSIGEHWKFNVIKKDNIIIIKSRSDVNKFIKTKVYEREELIDIFKCN